MKIIIPVEENRTDVCVSFGRTPLFMLHDTESGKNEYTVNPAVNAQSGAGIKAAQTAVDLKADALITVRCGENAAAVLKAAGIKIYRAEGTNAPAEISRFTDGRLCELSRFTAGFRGGR